MSPSASSQEPSQLSSWYTQGASDGLGDRLLMFDNTSTDPLELLRVRPDFACLPEFERRLRWQLERLSDFSHQGFARARSVNHLDDGEGLTAVSAHVPGTRLSELFPHGRTHSGTHPTLIRGILGELTGALAALHGQGPMVAHGLLAPERIVFAADRHVVITDYIFADAISALRLPAERLWEEFGIVPVPGAENGELTQRGDVVQLAVIGLSLGLGRRVTPEECGRQRLRLLDAFATACDSQASGSGRPLRDWVQQALDHNGFRTASEADESLQRLPAPALLTAHESRRAVDGLSTIALARPTFSRAVPSTRAAEWLGPPSPQDDGVIRNVASPKRSRVIQWMAGGLAVIGVVQGAIIAGLVFRTPSASSGPTVPPRVSSHAAFAPETASETPLPGSDVRNAVPAGAVVASSAAAVDSPLDNQGRLRIASAIPLQVVEGRRVLGESGGSPLFLRPGTHVLEFINATFDFRATEQVQIAPGRQAELSVALPTGTVNVNAQPWAQVLIDGQTVGDTPLANLSVVIGEHEVLFRHPQLGERRQPIVVKNGALTRVSATFAP